MVRLQVNLHAVTVNLNACKCPCRNGYTAWACSSAGRASALQLSRLNHISAASGVAYTQTARCNQPLNWTEGGRKITLTGAMALVRSSSECADGSQPPTLRLTAE